jgi:peptidylprolyl isomerase
MTIPASRTTSLAFALCVGSSVLIAQTASHTTTAATHHTTTATHRTSTASACPVAMPAISPKIPALAPPVAKCPTVEYALTYIDTKIGTGELAQPHKWYTVHYTGYLPDGTKFDSSVDRGEPITFPYGAHRVITGWDTGFDGMRVGGKRRLFVPYELAYGETGRPPVIPAKSPLIFDVEFISQSDTPPAPKALPAAPPTAPAQPGAPATPPAPAAPSTPPAPASTTTPSAQPATAPTPPPSKPQK